MRFLTNTNYHELLFRKGAGRLVAFFLSELVIHIEAC